MPTDNHECEEKAYQEVKRMVARFEQELRVRNDEIGKLYQELTIEPIENFEEWGKTREYPRDCVDIAGRATVFIADFGKLKAAFDLVISDGFWLLEMGEFLGSVESSVGNIFRTMRHTRKEDDPDFGGLFTRFKMALVAKRAMERVIKAAEQAKASS
jgi:hypothetical protein